MLRFDNRVAIVTGAGAGLGREYALLLASRGAKVIVNDLGGSRSGEGASSSAADKVVAEIRKAGGIAVADYNSVVNGERIVKTAIDNFGKIDILINNAGILRDKSFQKMTKAEWDIILDVHLKGAFVTTQAAWEYFKNQKYGRIIFTSSNAGLYGNFGQANYSSAKMALVGLCNTLSLEGKRYNIYSNVIVPTAASRLTEDILPPDLFEELKPELIAPVVIWLCHEDCEETGSIIESAAGWAGKQALVRGKGALLRQKISDIVKPENVKDIWSEVINMNEAEQMSSIQEVTMALMTCLGKLKDRSQQKNDSETLSTGEDMDYTLSHRDFIIYSLGIGASVENSSDLKYLYENHEEFQAFPTHSIIPGLMALMTSQSITSAIPGRHFDLSQILHGEQYLEVFKPLPLHTSLRNEVKIIDVLDKGKNAVIVCGVHTYDSLNELLCYNEIATVVKGEGGFGGPSASSKAIPVSSVPSRAPDSICSEETSVNQAAIYRLAGDSNPLHIDPAFSQLGGYDKPILHGLCTLGFSARHILMRFGGNNPKYFKSIKARFIKPCFPGDTLKTYMWREGNRIYFQTKNHQNTIIVDGAYVDLHKVVDTGSVDQGSIKLQFIDPKAPLSNRIIVSKLSNSTSTGKVHSPAQTIYAQNANKDEWEVQENNVFCSNGCSTKTDRNKMGVLGDYSVILPTFFGHKL